MPRPRFESLDPERRGAILSAASEEFARAGFDGASYNRIIERAGVSKGAMYYYFDDKADLCLTTLRDAIERATRRIGGLAPFDDAHGFWDSLEELFRRLVEFVSEEPALARLLSSLLASPLPPRLGEAVAAFTLEIQGDLEQLLERGVAVGAVRDDLPLDLLARTLTAMGDAGDRWSLERWQELGATELARYPGLMLELHMRVAAPLALVVERMARFEGSPP